MNKPDKQQVVKVPTTNGNNVLLMDTATTEKDVESIERSTHPEDKSLHKGASSLNVIADTMGELNQRKKTSSEENEVTPNGSSSSLKAQKLITKEETPLIGATNEDYINSIKRKRVGCGIGLGVAAAAFGAGAAVAFYMGFPIIAAVLLACAVACLLTLAIAEVKLTKDLNKEEKGCFQQSLLTNKNIITPNAYQAF